MTIIDLTYADLHPSPANVRRTRGEDGLEALGHDIKAEGLLLNLAVEEQGGRYAVLDGERRRQAIGLAIEKGWLPRDFPIPCRLFEGVGEGASLATFVHREGLHGADGRRPMPRSRRGASLPARSPGGSDGTPSGSSSSWRWDG